MDWDGHVIEVLTGDREHFMPNIATARRLGLYQMSLLARFC